MLAIAGTTCLVASPALAASSTVTTAGWTWADVEDTTLGIDDASSIRRDVLGSGLDLAGWTEDAFDNGFLSDVGYSWQVSDYLYPTPVSFDSVPGEGATVVASVSHDVGGGEDLDVDFTLEIAGSFARWTFDLSDGGGGFLDEVELYGGGELGSDDPIATPVGTDGLVMSDGTQYDPVLGFHIAADGSAATVSGQTGLDLAEFTATGASTVVLTVALLDYDPCRADDAVAEMVALVPSLPDHFGEDLAPLSGSCVTVGIPEPMTAGKPTDQLLDLAFTGALAGGSPRLDQQSYLDYVDTWTSGLAAIAAGLPEGLAVEVVPHPVTMEPALRLFGTPTASGNGEAPLVLYGATNGPDVAGELPLDAAIRFDVAAAPVLPATGPALSAGLLTAGLVALAAGATLRFAARRSAG